MMMCLKTLLIIYSFIPWAITIESHWKQSSESKWRIGASRAAINPLQHPKEVWMAPALAPRIIMVYCNGISAAVEHLPAPCWTPVCLGDTAEARVLLFQACLKKKKWTAFVGYSKLLQRSSQDLLLKYLSALCFFVCYLCKVSRNNPDTHTRRK